MTIPLDCPLCRLYLKRELVTPLYYEDAICIIVDCATHPSKKLIVLKRHAELPTTNEAEHIQEIAYKLFPRKIWRYPASLPDHFHLHEINTWNRP